MSKKWSRLFLVSSFYDKKPRYHPSSDLQIHPVRKILIFRDLLSWVENFLVGRDLQFTIFKLGTLLLQDLIYILLDVLLCSIAEYFYELCRILASL